MQLVFAEYRLILQRNIGPDRLCISVLDLAICFTGFIASKALRDRKIPHAKYLFDFQSV